MKKRWTCSAAWTPSVAVTLVAAACLLCGPAEGLRTARPGTAAAWRQSAAARPASLAAGHLPRIRTCALTRLAADRSERDVDDVGAGPADDGPPTARDEEITRLLLAAGLGIATGLCVAWFKASTAWLQEFAYNQLLFDVFVATRDLAKSPLWTGLIIALVPSIGGMLVSVSAWFAAATAADSPGSRGGIGGNLGQLVDEQRPVSGTAQVWRTVAAVSTLGTGNSLGPEGPSVEIGASLARIASRELRVSVEWQQLLLSAGAAAGVAAGFNAPIAAVFFTVEIVQPLQRPGLNALSRANVGSVLVCAVMAALTVREVLAERLAFTPALYDLRNPPLELPLYVGLGAVSGLLSLAFKALLRRSEALFNGRLQQQFPRAVQPAFAGFVCGAAGLAFPQVLFFGYSTLDSILANTDPLPLTYLLELCGIKLLLTALCSGCGLVGGVFAPSLFLGATAGAAYQQVMTGIVADAAHALTAFQSSFEAVPGSWGVLGVLEFQIADVPPYAMVGAASVLAGMFNAPLTSSLLLFELTRDFDVILPLMASTGVSSLVNDLVGTTQLRQRPVAPLGRRAPYNSTASPAAPPAGSASAVAEPYDRRVQRPSRDHERPLQPDVAAASTARRRQRPVLQAKRPRLTRKKYGRAAVLPPPRRRRASQ